MAIVRVRKEVTLWGKSGEMAIVRVRKDVTLGGKNGENAKLIESKNKTLHPELRGKCYRNLS
jgi:hypothetical protein